jgi:hypothetical protein
MKFELTFKTPDVIDQATHDLTDDRDEAEVVAFAKKFVKYGEYIIVDFDTDAGTATVRRI